jgi:hypothetical protein
MGGLHWLDRMAIIFLLLVVTLLNGCAHTGERTYYQLGAGDMFDGNWEDNDTLTTQIEFGHEYKILESHWFGASYKHTSQAWSGAPYNDDKGESRSSWIGLHWRGEFYQ